MATLGDEILRATGGPTVSDGLRSWYNATVDETLSDAERRWLLAFPATTAGTNDDLWVQFLHLFPGTVNDKKLAYWTGQL